jgi:CrcB protein
LKGETREFSPCEEASQKRLGRCGALVIGVFVGLARLPGGPLESASAHAFVVTGLLGGYTTVSSFSLQTLNLLLSDKTALAALNVAASTILPPLAVAGGYDAVGWLAA